MPGAPSFVRSLLVASAAFAAAIPARAAQAPKPLPPAKLEALESAARGKAAAELIALAKFAESLKAAPEARAACATANLLEPHDSKARDVVEKLAKLKGERAKDADKQFAEKKAKAGAKCVELLTPVFAAYADADRSDELARLMGLLRELALPVDALMKKHEFAFYAPYSDWRRKKDVDRFAAGWELLDGVWLDQKKVAELDAKHAEWSDPWQFGEEVHAIKTTLPLSTARRVLATVVAYRTFVLAYFGLDVDLRPPAVKLPLIVTKTRAEMEARALADGDREPLPKGMAAFYEGGSRAGGRCFVSFELNAVDGAVLKADFEGLRSALLHEVAHQILHEYTRWGFDLRTRPTEDLNWVGEGVAEFLPCFEPDGGTWTLHYRKGVKQGNDRTIEGGYGWCHDHVDQLVPLAQFVKYSKSQMGSVQAYHQAQALATYLLESKDRTYRMRFCKLVTLEHQYKADGDSFAACFPGVDVAALDADFRAWCKGLAIEGKAGMK